jgi:hypothetical protein
MAVQFWFNLELLIISCYVIDDDNNYYYYITNLFQVSVCFSTTSVFVLLC